MNDPQPTPSLNRTGRRPARSLFAFIVLAAIEVARPAAPQGAQSACPPQPPVSLRISESSAGWTVAVKTPPDKAYTDILIGLDGAPPTSTGHDRALDVYTGKPQARGWRILPAGVPAGQHRVEVQLVRRDGTVDGPHIFVFDRAVERLAEAKKTLERLGDQVLSFSEHGDEVTWLGFSLFFDYRDSLREIRYSIDSCSLDERVVFAADPAAEPVAEGRRLPNDLILDRPFLTLPKATTRSACAQVVFRDGTLSQVFQAHRPPQPTHRNDPTEPEPTPTPCACLPDPVLPVALVAHEWDGEWTLVFRTPECPPLAELRVRVDDGEPTPKGRGKRLDSRTHRLSASHYMVLRPGPDGPDVDRRLQVELVRPDGRVDGPYALLFSPREERLAAAKETIARSPYTFVSFAEHGSDSTWLGFHTLFDLGRSLREVRYSIDDCSLGKRLVFSDDGPPVADPAVAPGDLTTDRPFLTLPRDSTRSACVQVVFADGSTSEVLEIVREPRYRKRRS